MDNIDKNRQFQLMLEPARERLKRYTIEELCEKGNIQFCNEESKFVVSSMGQEIKIQYPDFVIEQELFPPSGKVLVDENAEHYLTIEAAGGACIIVANAIIDKLKNKAID